MARKAKESKPTQAKHPYGEPVVNQAFGEVKEAAKQHLSLQEYKAPDYLRMAKCAFWSSYEADPLTDNPEIDLELIKKHLDPRRAQLVADRWQDENFKAWFLASTEEQARLSFLFSKSLDTLEEVLNNQEPSAQSARVNAAKLLAELGGKLKPRNHKPENNMQKLMDQVSKMDKVALQTIVSSNKGLLGMSVSGENNSREENSYEVIEAKS